MNIAMRLLGIDYGIKRVGVALSDEGGAMAFPHATYNNDASVFARITALCAEKNVGVIVLGESRSLAGESNPLQKDIDAFRERLGREGAVSIVFEPEQFTTQAALRLQGRTTQTDASAAALILDSYIHRQKTPHDSIQ